MQVSVNSVNSPCSFYVRRFKICYLWRLSLSHDGLSNEGLDLTGIDDVISMMDSSGSLSDFYKSYGCAPFSGACCKLLVEICIALGDAELLTNHKPWVTVSFVKHADDSGIGSVWHMISVAGLPSPWLSSSGLRLFYNDQWVLERSFRLFLRPIDPARLHLSAPGNCIRMLAVVC